MVTHNLGCGELAQQPLVLGCHLFELGDLRGLHQASVGDDTATGVLSG